MIHSAWPLRSFLGIAALFALHLATRAEPTAPSTDLPVSTPQTRGLPTVPWIETAEYREGALTITTKSRIIAEDKSLLPLAQIFAREIALVTGRQLTIANGATAANPSVAGDIVLRLARIASGYTLEIADQAIVTGADYASAAYGTATLLQLLRVKGGKGNDSVVEAPRVSCADAPKLTYCGAMLDVARKPHSLATLRQCIEVCRLYKIRYLQLHMTDENAWTFPSTAYPQLGSKNFAWAGGEAPRVYPKEELKALVAYAEARGVVIVPEIEMPGHSGQMQSAMPEVFGYRNADGKQQNYGVINMISPAADAALDTLVGEIAEIFHSSPYIHLGMDEASPEGIVESAEAKEFMKQRGLKNAYDIFNLFVTKMDGMVKKRGRKMIVWEGAPIDPKRPPLDVIFMPWVGDSPAAGEYVRAGYEVINAPWGVKLPYMDPYLVNGSQLKQGEPKLVGAVSILWESTEDKAVPYLRQTGALRNEPTYRATNRPLVERGHADLLARLVHTDAVLDRLLHGYTFRANGTHAVQTFMRLEPTFDRPVSLELETALPHGDIHYTLDGSEPTTASPAATAPIAIDRTTTIRAKYLGSREDVPRDVFVRTYARVPAVKHAGIGAQVKISPAAPGYPGPGAKGLVDGLLAEGDSYSSAGWVGWARYSKPVVIDIDLGKSQNIEQIAAHTLRSGGGVDFPKSIAFETSEDGKSYAAFATVERAAAGRAAGWYLAKAAPRAARYLRLAAKANGDWTFLDEIAVNPTFTDERQQHAALGKKVALTNVPAEQYSLSGVEALTDGVEARSPEFLNPAWVGVEGKNFEATIDLEAPTAIDRVEMRFLQHIWAGIHVPARIDIATSEDGKKFEVATTATGKGDQTAADVKTVTASLGGKRARYLRVTAHTDGMWIFADEILVHAKK